MNVSIVTASDEGYFITLTQLLESLHGIDRLGDFSIHVLDIGLSQGQHQQLTGGGIRL